MSEPKSLPVGEADFRTRRRQNHHFADKSKFIPQLEPARSKLPFIRPSRFGKSNSSTQLNFIDSEVTAAEAGKQWAEAVGRIRQYAGRGARR